MMDYLFMGIDLFHDKPAYGLDCFQFLIVPISITNFIPLYSYESCLLFSES